MKRALAVLGLLVLTVALSGDPASAAVAVPARPLLRGHLPELGERPTMRVFVTQAEYDTYRNSLGDANIFPAASSLSMSFDKDVLALYTRGNDTGGRCIGTQIFAGFSGDTLTVTAPWQTGTCGAPSTAHYPFILVAVSRTASDGSTWLPSARSVCLSVESADTNACATLSGGASPSPTSSPASVAPSASAAPSATRSLTPSQTVAAASPTPVATTAAATATRSPVAAASPATAADDAGTNVLLYAMLIAIAFLVLLSLFLSRGGRRS